MNIERPHLLSCPVCQTKMNGAICMCCGYTHILFPSHLPPQLQKFEHRRIEVMRKVRAKIKTENGFSQQISNTQIIGVLVIRNLMTESHFVFPIYKGKNIYGTELPNEPLCHKLDSIIIGIDLPDIIFAIDASEDALRLLPNKDFPLSINRVFIMSPMTIDDSDYFFYSNVLFFNAIRFQSK